MLRALVRFAFASAATVMLRAAVAFAAESAPPDPFMGDWTGRVLDAGRERPIAAQIIALGRGMYRANILDALYKGHRPLAVLDGKRQGDTVVFGPNARIENGVFRGSAPGVAGTFEMKPTRVLSPTLGAKPPAGAIVLFDGSGFEEWEQPGQTYGLVDLNHELGRSQNCVAYLRNAVYSDAPREVQLLVGSDDGVRVWLNGELVHDANVFRPFLQDQDRLTASLKSGWNDLLVKVSQGGGDWSVRVRIVGPDGRPVPGLRVRYAARDAQGAELVDLGPRTNGVILCWQVSGPYRSKNVPVSKLLETAFPPETSPEKASWKMVGETEPPKGPRWKLTDDGAMEVVPGTGNLLTKRRFTDFRLHIEFRTPFMPEARGQARGNSGVYLQGRYEIQVLDSYGLEGRDNECGGIYKVARPRINMCAPPLQWQTYDIVFHAPRFDASGKKTADAVATVRHNGVVIHENVRIPHPTGGGIGGDPSEPGPLMLQDHHNPVRYRNIWIVPLDR